MTSRAVQAALLCVVTALALSPDDALAQSASRAKGAGLRLGANYSILTGPSDPAGSPTLLFGSAFDGRGGALGASLFTELTELAGGRLDLRVDVLYSRHNASGFARDLDTDQTQTIALRLDMVRLPVLVSYERPVIGELSVRAGLGPELLFGVQSGSTVTYENIPETPPELPTVPTTHIGATASLGASWAFGRISLPVDLRVTWDPAVASTTVGRFDGYESPEALGRFRAAFDWQFVVLMGVDVSL